MDDNFELAAMVLMVLALAGASLAIGQIYLASRASPFDQFASVSTARMVQHRSFGIPETLSASVLP